MQRFLFVLVLAGLLCLATVPALATPFAVTLTFNESCQGTFANTAGFSSPLPCSQITDPGPGGLTNATYYGMLNPPGLTAGDVLIYEPGTETLSDILRFDSTTGNGGLFVYDIAFGFPTSYSSNTLTMEEAGTADGWRGLIYTPIAGQPGFVVGAGGPVTYNFTSDAPEPAAFWLAGPALALLGVLRLWKR